MHDSLTITCPHCGEDFPIPVDASEGGAEFVTDCEICCRPMTVVLRVQAGEIAGVEVTPA